VAVALTSAVGLVAFGWPLMLGTGTGTGTGLRHAANAPWFFTARLPLVVVVVVVVVVAEVPTGAALARVRVSRAGARVRVSRAGSRGHPDVSARGRQVSRRGGGPGRRSHPAHVVGRSPRSRDSWRPFRVKWPTCRG
jgi:hypothetical protein